MSAISVQICNKCTFNNPGSFISLVKLSIPLTVYNNYSVNQNVQDKPSAINLYTTIIYWLRFPFYLGIKWLSEMFILRTTI